MEAVMKKTVLILITLLILISSTGCATTKRLTCNFKSEGGEITVDIDYSRDTINNYKYVSFIETDPAFADMIFGVLVGLLEEYNSIKGLSTSIEASEDKKSITLTMEVDYKKLDKKALKALAAKPGAEPTFADTFGKQASLSDTRADLEEQGYICN